MKSFSNDWYRCKLSDITDLITKGSTLRQKSNSNDVNFIKIEDIVDGSIIPGKNFISFSEHKGPLKRSILKNKDILFSIAGTLGKSSIISSDLLPANTNQALAIIRLKQNVNVDYILYFLRSSYISKFINNNPTIGAQPNISLSQVGSFEIPIPNDENYIFKIVLMFNKLDSIIKFQRRKIKNLKLLKKYLMQNMFI